MSGSGPALALRQAPPRPFGKVWLGKQIFPDGIVPVHHEHRLQRAAPSPTMRTWVSRQESNPFPPSRCSWPMFMPPV